MTKTVDQTIDSLFYSEICVVCSTFKRQNASDGLGMLPTLSPSLQPLSDMENPLWIFSSVRRCDFPFFPFRFHLFMPRYWVVVRVPLHTYENVRITSATMGRYIFYLTKTRMAEWITWSDVITGVLPQRGISTWCGLYRVKIERKTHSMWPLLRVSCAMRHRHALADIYRV